MYHNIDKQNQAIKDFRDHLDYLGSESLPEPDLEKLYDQPVYLAFNSHSIAIPFNAPVYHALKTFIDTIVEEVI